MYVQGTAVDPAQQRRILEAALAAAGQAGARGVLIFDLDSTLLDNRPRQARILREFGRARGVSRLAEARAEHFTGWSLGDAMRAAGLGEDEVAALVGDGKEFWRQRFFTSEYCVDDVPIRGAVEFTRAVRASGAQIAYVTGRHTPMGPGTVACFEREGFPLPDGRHVHLMLKPAFETTDDDWKLLAFREVDALGEVVAAFDNEPAHINGYAARYPGALSVRLATDDSGRPIAVAPGVVQVADFAR